MAVGSVVSVWGNTVVNSLVVFPNRSDKPRTSNQKRTFQYIAFARLRRRLAPKTDPSDFYILDLISVKNKEGIEEKVYRCSLANLAIALKARDKSRIASVPPKTGSYDLDPIGVVHCVINAPTNTMAEATASGTVVIKVNYPPKFADSSPEADEDLSRPVPGDLVIYGKSNGDNNHVAVVMEVKPGSSIITRVRSKWNGGAIYDHDPNETLAYGKNWTVWRRRRKPTSNNPEMRNILDVGTDSGSKFLKTDKQRL